MSCYYERSSPTVDPTNGSLTLLALLCVMASLYSVCLSLGISASVFSPLLLSLYLPLPPNLLLFLLFCFIISLSFCPLQANPQTSIRSKQGSLTFNFLLATYFSIVCTFPPFLGLFLCSLNRWMDVALDE